MVARVTLAEIDTMRMPLEEAIELYKSSVLPAMEQQPGYEGVCVLTTAEGKALVISFWDSEEAADRGVESGFYGEQVEKFVTVFRSPPGRESYQVVLAETSSVTVG